MRKLVILLLLAGISTGQAQIIQLDEARVDAKNTKIISDGDGLKFTILEEYSNQFQKNPLTFMNENFDIFPFIEQMRGKNYVSYKVQFRNSKGYLNANFDKKGTLISTSQRFKNIVVPKEVSRELLAKYKGWAMTKNIYMASGKGDDLDMELYKITMKNGKKSKIVKITPSRSSSSGLVSY